MEQRGGISQVFYRVTIRQGDEYVFKNIVAVGNAGINVGTYRDGGFCSFGVIGCKGSAKMNPIYSPWVVVVGAVGMRGVGWQNEILVGLYIILMSIYLVFATAIYAIYQDILVDGGFAFAIMVHGMWIKSHVCDVECAQYGV